MPRPQPVVQDERLLREPDVALLLLFLLVRAGRRQRGREHRLPLVVSLVVVVVSGSVAAAAVAVAVGGRLLAVLVQRLGEHGPLTSKGKDL